jgi:hypothetical protein
MPVSTSGTGNKTKDISTAFCLLGPNIEDQTLIMRVRFLKCMDCGAGRDAKTVGIATAFRAQLPKGKSLLAIFIGPVHYNLALRSL